MREQWDQLMSAARVVRQANAGDLVLVGYGSLPDKPEPGWRAVGPVLVEGWAKRMCIEVSRCRGTPEVPGLVAGLLPDAGAAAMGMLAVADAPDDPAVLEALARRELGGLAYDPLPVLCRAGDERTTIALAFVASIWHRQTRRLTVEAAADIIARAEGSCGPNRAYLDLLLGFETRAFGHQTPEIAVVKEALKDLPPFRQTLRRAA